MGTLQERIRHYLTSFPRFPYTFLLPGLNPTPEIYIRKVRKPFFEFFSTHYFLHLRILPMSNLLFCFFFTSSLHFLQRGALNPSQVTFTSLPTSLIGLPQRLHLRINVTPFTIINLISDLKNDYAINDFISNILKFILLNVKK